jgi:hypothetical protein
VTDAQSLLNQANCLSCYGSNPGMMDLLEVALLAQIANQPLKPTLVLTSQPVQTLFWDMQTPAGGWWFILPCGSVNFGSAFDKIGGANMSVQTVAPVGTSVWLIGTLADQTTIVLGPSNCVTVLP